MNRNARSVAVSVNYSARRATMMWVAALILGLGLAQHCRADSTLSAGSAGGAAISSSAHLDFRITILPSLALSMQATGGRVQGNSGGVVAQWDDRASSGTQLRQRRQITDTVVQASNAGSVLTVASP